MKLNHIRDVLAVAERGSFRSAARHLGLGQPSITRSIRELEHELGVTLFERRASGVVLTPMGSAFLRRATGIQREFERVREEMEQFRGVGRGTVAIALSPVAHVALLPRVIEPFRQRHPDVRLKISEGLFPAMEADIQDGTTDFYVGPLAENYRPGELLVEPLFDHRRTIVGRKGHPLSATRSLADLADARWVTGALTLVSEAELDPIFDGLGLPRPKVVVETQTALSIVMVAAHSDLLAMLPLQWFEFFAPTNLVRRIDVREELAAPTICLVHRARLPLTPAAEYLCDFIRRAAVPFALGRGE